MAGRPPKMVRVVAGFWERLRDAASGPVCAGRYRFGTGLSIGVMGAIDRHMMHTRLRDRVHAAGLA